MTEADSADPFAFAVHVWRDVGLRRVVFVPRVKCSTHVLLMQRGRSSYEAVCRQKDPVLGSAGTGLACCMLRASECTSVNWKGSFLIVFFSLMPLEIVSTLYSFLTDSHIIKTPVCNYLFTVTRLQ